MASLGRLRSGIGSSADSSNWQHGLGLGIMAGLALNSNLWHHYLLTVLLGLALIASGLIEQPKCIALRGGIRIPAFRRT